MRSSTGWLGGFALTLLLTGGPGLCPAATPDTTDALYKRATEAVLAGDGSERVRLLKELLEADPDYEPARAELGQVRHEDRWVPAKHAMRMASYDPAIAEHRERVADAQETPDAHRSLARWCSRQGLDPETRMHWFALIRSEPTDREALEGLNAEWRDGLLWDRDLADRADEREKQRGLSAGAWEKRFRKFERERKVGEETLARIESDLDAAAAAPIERRALERSENEKSRRLVEAFISASERLEEVKVTACLCRIAVAAADADLRGLATTALAARPLSDVGPLLLSMLESPIESRSEILTDGRGNVVYSHMISRTGEERDAVHMRTRTAQVGIVPLRDPSLSRSDMNTIATIEGRRSTMIQELRFRLEAEQTEQAIADYNAGVAEANSYVFDVLAQVVDEPVENSPAAWWRHWREYTGYDRYDERPVDRTYEVSSRTYAVPGPDPNRHECFLAGTPVWTRTGLRPIETLEPGDLVLARDPDRGGLTYRAVLETTRRRPSPMLAVTAGGETLHATTGHPFWVVGRGWRMAKQIEVGDLLSTVEGPVAVEAIEEHAPNPAHNLVVEGAANYYVGEAGMLVHDNTPRRPAVGLVARR